MFVSLRCSVPQMKRTYKERKKMEFYRTAYTLWSVIRGNVCNKRVGISGGGGGVINFLKSGKVFGDLC